MNAEPESPAAPAVAAAFRPAPPAPPVPSSGGALKRLLVPVGVLASVAGAFAYVGAVDPNEPGHYPVCPLLHYTGIWCPGCGGLRSAHAFVHGDLGTAFGANAAAVVGYFLFAAFWVVWAARSAQGRPLRLDPGPVTLWTAGALLLAFTVVRNLPFGGWLHP